MSQASLDREPLAPMAKRKHALLELLSSERVYASDLALMRHIHIPMALGQSSHFQAPDIPPSVSADYPPSTKPASSGASSSLTRSAPTNEVNGRPPMTAEDVRVIFSNTEDLAVFADAFAERIETAMGDALEAADEGTLETSDPGFRTDAIGELFLAVVGLIQISSLMIGSLIQSKLGASDETTVHNIYYAASISPVTFNYAHHRPKLTQNIRIEFLRRLKKPRSEGGPWPWRNARDASLSC